MNAFASEKLSDRRCPQCGRPVRVGCYTCLRSQCQEAEYYANKERNAARKRRKARR